MSKVHECLFSTTADTTTFTFPLVASSQMGSETFSSIKCLKRLKCDDTRRQYCQLHLVKPGPLVFMKVEVFINNNV